MKASATQALNKQIVREAAAWFVEFRVGDVDAQVDARFNEWLRRSPEHIRAYMEIARTYVELPPLDVTNLDATALIARAHAGSNVHLMDKGVSTPHTPGVDRQPNVPMRAGIPGARSCRRFLLAAAVSLLFGVTCTLIWQMSRFPLYSADIGERRSLTLPDGSTVDLNARSSIRIEFTSNERHVELLGGQALFQVAKDSARPFIVKSGNAAVRAVGTQFDVYRKDAATTVTVLEGRVAIFSDARSAAQAQPNRALRHAFEHDAGEATSIVSAGEQVTVTSREIIPAAHADLTAATAWTQRKLIFDGTKLSDVALEFNRYNRRRIVIDSGALADYHVSGVYSSSDPASLIRFLRGELGVAVEESDAEIHIRAP